MTRDILAVMVLSTMAATSGAQDTIAIDGPITVQTPVAVYANPPLRAGYQSRAEAAVYDNVPDLSTTGREDLFLASCNQILEDVSFAGGPWGLPYAAPRVITSCTFAVAAVNTPIDPAMERVFLVFWDTQDVAFGGFTGAGTNMIRPGASPLGAYVFAIGSAQLPYLSVGGLNVPVPSDADGVVVQAGWINIDSGVPTDWSDLSANLDESCPSAGNRGIVFGSNSMQTIGGNPATVGATLPGYGRDHLSGVVCNSLPSCTHAGVFIGAAGPPASGGCSEYRQQLFTTAPIGFRQLGYRIRLAGDVVQGPTCTPDVNQDGATDQGDVDYLINALAGGSNPNNIDTDFNQDGASDQGDIDALVNVVAGGPCP